MKKRDTIKEEARKVRAANLLYQEEFDTLVDVFDKYIGYVTNPDDIRVVALSLLAQRCKGERDAEREIPDHG